MNSPRKVVPVMVSPRGSGAIETRNKLDSSQLTPRQRKPLEALGRQGGATSTLLPSRATPLPVATLGQLSANKPKAAPRSDFEIKEELLEDANKVRKESGRGSGDAVLRLPLEGLSKLEIKNELMQSPNKPVIGNIGDRTDEEQEDFEEDERHVEDAFEGPDRARFNVWNGKNYDLHVLGDFKNEFEKNVKSFQRPSTEPLLLDPFCRAENGLINEPTRSDAFLLWKSKSNAKWRSLDDNETVISSPFLNSLEEHCENESDGDSLPDPEMSEYISSQQQKREEGLNVAGETLYYDEDYAMVRNLHRDSYSLTNYGTMPDEKWIGKANLFYPEMTEAEKKMLRAQDPKKKQSSLSPRIAVVRRGQK